MKLKEKLKSEVQKDLERIEKAKRERSTLIAQTAYFGKLGLMLVLPVVAGGYLGSWLDNELDSVSWMITFIFLGVFVGSVNVYLFVKGNE